MEIIGYSERGVMNALFYGIAFDKDSQKAEEAMNEILKLGGIEGDYTDFKIYVEFSLSEFGSPDLVFTASNSNGEKEVFFVEAKVSAGSYYDLDKQKDHHDDYMKRLKNSKYDKGHSSNLFFQLKEKYLLLKYGPNNYGSVTILDRVRKLGENNVVVKFYNDIKTSVKNAHYVAIIPEQEEYKSGTPFPVEFIDNGNKETMIINLISWEEISNDEILKSYIDSTMSYNTNDEDKSQIMNNK